MCSVRDITQVCQLDILINEDCNTIDSLFLTRGSNFHLVPLDKLFALRKIK